jgi:hypothetical protein
VIRLVLRVVVALVAVGLAIWLWQWSGDDTQGRGLQGGPLFDVASADVRAVEIRRPGATGTIERTDHGWRLTGDVDDLVDVKRFESVLASLLAGEGGPVLAGTEPDERRFGFGGESSVELVLYLVGGGRRRLALGDANPVSGLVYASGLGRVGVFGVGGGLYAEAARLPDAVRLPRLLPRLDTTDLDSLTLARRGDTPLVFARLDDGRWWLRLPGGVDDLAGRAARYHGRYADRQRTAAGATWVLADRRRLRDVVYRATDTAVVSFSPPGSLHPSLDPPYRTVYLHRTAGDTWSVALGEDLGQQRSLVPALRQTAPVITRGEVLVAVEGSRSDFLDLGALSVLVEDADSLTVDEPDRPLLWGVKADDPEARRRERRSVWDARTPAGWTLVFGPETTADHLGDLQTHLDRLPVDAVLPPSPNDPLQPTLRWRVRTVMPDGTVSTVWLGSLAADGRPALWEPRDGKVLVIPGEILLSLRNLRGDLARQ